MEISCPGSIISFWTYRAFLVGYAAQNLQRVSKEDQDKIYEAEWQTMVEKNNAWNNEVRALR